MLNWVGNTAHILEHVFNSASKQHHEDWASQFPFLHSLKAMIPPSEACLYGHIHWSLVQAHQKSSMGLSQSFPPMRGGEAIPKTGLHFNIQMRPMQESSDASLVKRPHLENMTEAHQGGTISSGGDVSASYTHSLKKGSHGDDIIGVLQYTTSLSPSSSVVQVVTLS